MQNLIKYYTQRPHIDSIGVIMKPGLLWSNVLLGSCDGLHDNLLGAKSEICNFYNWDRLIHNIFGFEQNVLGFKISMRDAMIMQLFDAFAYLVNHLQGIFFIHFVIDAVVQGIPELYDFYHKEPPSQYYVIYHMQVLLSIISNILRMFSFSTLLSYSFIVFYFSISSLSPKSLSTLRMAK